MSDLAMENLKAYEDEKALFEGLFEAAQSIVPTASRDATFEKYVLMRLGELRVMIEGTKKKGTE